MEEGKGKGSMQENQEEYSKGKKDEEIKAGT